MLLLTNVGYTQSHLEETTFICPIKDNKKAVYTFTTDDAIPAAAISYNADFKRLGLCGSLALVGRWIYDADNISNWAFWQQLVREGRFDVINHSMRHFKYSDCSNLPSGIDSLNTEINEAQTLFKSKFPTQDIIVTANPAVVNTPAADVIIKQNHYAARNGYTGYNSLSPNEDEWYKLNMQSTYNYTEARGATANELNTKVDYAIENNKWVIILSHGIGTKRNEITQANITAHFEYTATKLADMWCAKITDVTKYIKEKQHAKVKTMHAGNKLISVSLTHNLDTKVFDYPLTLKTIVPNKWWKAKVSQNGESIAITSVNENGVRFIYYDAVPNSSEIIITQSKQ